MPIRKSSNSGIPFGNTAGRPANQSGQPYFNGEIGRLELYTEGSGWQNIVQETPGVTSYTGTVLETNSTNTLLITGTNFVSGAIAYLIGNDGSEQSANTTTVNSIVSITAVFGSIDASKEPYDIKVVNPSNLFGLLPDAVAVNDKPVFAYASGSLGSFNEGTSVSISTLATDEENNSLTFSVSSGSLPTGLSLNSSTGVISGTAPSVSSNTTYSFTITATDSLNTSVSRAFSILINSIVTWNTTAGSIGTINPDVTTSFSYSLSATALGNTISSYSITSGALPSGLTLNSSTGLISGNVSTNVLTDTTYSFTVEASDGTVSASRSFSILLKPTIVTGGTLSTDSTYIYRTFLGNGTLSLTQPLTMEILCVAGGGGGRTGANGGDGGGGAGGLVYHSGKSLSSGSYSITVGGGGTSSTNGGNSTISDITANGGGAGAASGGSAGGGVNINNSPGAGCGAAQGSATQGNSGGGLGYGNGGGQRHENHYQWAGGGGGGAGGVGLNNKWCGGPSSYASQGGPGRTYSQFAGLISQGHDGGFAGGGSGAHENYGNNVGYRVTASVGFGGGASDSNGTSNTGGGGGGINMSGGSGVVIVRYTKASVGG